MKKALVLIALLLAACSAKEIPIQVVTVEVPITFEIPVTVEVTRQVTEIVVVTATPLPMTPTPPGPSPTPSLTPTPEPTLDRTKTDRRDGSYLVPDEIAPGIWRSSKPSDPGESCWIIVESLGGDLLDISGNLAGDTIRVPSRPAIVLIGGGSGNRCTWSFLQP